MDQDSLEDKSVSRVGPDTLLVEQELPMVCPDHNSLVRKEAHAALVLDFSLRAQGNRRAHTSQLPQNLSRSWSLIAAMNFTGLVAHKIVELSRERPAIDREAWMAYFEAFILPHLGNAARGEPNSVIVIDNAVRSATTCAARAPVRNAAQTAADCAAAYRVSTGSARWRTAR